MNKSIVIIGAGPAGLSCGTQLAKDGYEVVIFERKSTVGTKVCAGGITCNGILDKIPSELIQRAFTTPHVFSSLQQFILKEDQPILATVNREELGREMLNKALDFGVKVHYNSHVTNIDSKHVYIKNKESGKQWTTPYSTLIGADGAGSAVRRYLGLSSLKFGIGINYQLPISMDKMEWHFIPELFKNGYAWIFPHKNTTSVGAYACSSVITSTELKTALLKWASRNSLDLSGVNPKAEKILYDYKGWNFNNIFLVGEAAGLTSAITGEGINSAILSGEVVAKYISNPKTESIKALEKLINRHRMHLNLSRVSSSSKLLYRILPETALLGLKLKILPFSKLELTA